MPRPKKCRRICAMPSTKGFMPIGNVCSTQVKMSVDEYESIRLIDLQCLTQEECAKQMGIARTTVTGIYEQARHKLADALVNGKHLFIEGGDIIICEHRDNCCHATEPKQCCRHRKNNEMESIL